MKISKKSVAIPLLQVDDSCATLLSIEDSGTFIYEFRYYAFIIKALKSSASTVRISIRNELPQKTDPTAAGVTDFADVKSFVDGVLKIDSKVKDAKRDARIDVVAAANSDITSKFDNSMTSAVKEAASETIGVKRSIKTATVAELKQSNVNVPVLQTTVKTNFKPSAGKVQEACIDLVMKGIDPASAAERHEPSTGAFSAFSGYGTRVLQSSVSSDNVSVAPANVLKRDAVVSSYHIESFDNLDSRTHFSDDASIPMIVDVPARYILNSKTMRITSSIGFDDFYAVFELIDSDGVAIETVTKRVSHSSLVRLYNTPVTPPKLAVAPTQFPGKNVLEIMQTDPVAQRVRILRRQLRKVDSNIYDATYDVVTELPLKKKDGMLKFTDIVNNSSMIMYRCIAIGAGGLVGTGFSSASSTPVQLPSSPKYQRSYAAVMNAKITASGIQVAVTKIPPGVVAVAVLRRDLTLHETIDSFLETIDPIRVVGALGGNLTFLDASVKRDHIYEYRCMLFFDDGLQVISTAYASKLYLPLSVGAATINVTNVNVTRGAGLDVKFNVVSTLSDEGLSLVKRLIEKQGLQDLYRDELKSEREKLEKLLAHSITRIDISTGLEESFGTFTGTSFSDAREGVKNGVSRLREGRRYRYIISTLIRDAETMFDKLEKTESDPATGKQFKFKPAFFRHPLTLNRGTIVNRETLRSNHPEDDFSHGNLGNVHEVDISIDVSPPAVKDVKAFRLDRRMSTVKWTVDGSVDKIDHFVVIKEKLGQTSIAGKMHGFSTGNSFEFVDPVTPDDIGDVSYRIVPVLTDFSQAPNVVSNKLLIEDKRGRI